MNLSELSIRRPVFAWMLMAALIVFGALSFSKLGVSQLPDVDFPVVGVSLTLPGSAPEVIETQVIDPIEDAIMEIGGVRSITSTSSQSSGSIAVEFELDRNIDEAVQEVQNRLAQVSNLLPPTLKPPTVRKRNPEDQPILWVAVTANPGTSKVEMMNFARNYLYDQFGTVSGVGDIALGGYVDPALRVWANYDKMKAQQVTADDILSAIQTEHIEIPAGRIENASHEFNVRVMGEAQTPEEFGKLLIKNRSSLGPNFKALRLNQVADVELGTVDVRRISRFNSKMAVGLGILKQHGSNAVEVARLVREKLEEIRPSIPPQYNVLIRSDSTRFIKQSVDELTFMLLLSALLTSVVCYLFLGSWTSTVNVLMAIPTSIVGTFMGILAFGFTLNTFTLLGLSLAIGIVVDDAIMMLENIVRHRELGEKRKEAALKGSKEITFAALAATIAVIAIFLPVVFMKGVIGRYLYQYGITVTIAVGLSLLEALTLTPMRCSRFLEVKHNPGGFAGFVDRLFAKLARNYGKVLSVLLAHRWKTLVVALLIFVGSFFFAHGLPQELMPAQDQAQILLRIKLPVGSAIDMTDEKFKEAEAHLQKMPGVEGVFSVVGGFGGDAVNQGNIIVSLVDRDKRKFSQAELMKKIRDELSELLNKKEKSDQALPTGQAPAVHVGTPDSSHKPGGGGGKGRRGGDGIQVIAQDLSLRGFSSGRGFPVEFIVQGPDWGKLTESTNQLMDELRATGALTDLNTDIQPGVPEIQLIPDRDKMARHGVSTTAVTSVLNSLVGGATLNGQTEYPKDGHRYEIELRLRADQRNKAEQLSQIRVRNNRGETVPLSEVVSQQQKPALVQISRLNRARAITVYANPAVGHSQQEALKLVESTAKSVLPPGYAVKMTGSSQSFKETFQSLFVALLLGILVSYMVLASQFNSFIHPVTVLMALPFSLTGAFVGLSIFHQSINVYSMIGLILLMGIVKKNSILLVDFTNHCRTEGLDVHAALLKACPVRLRPILMTSVATVAGALPEALSIGPGAETTVPMAIAIIGGVIASTVLTLFVVPCVYSLFSRLEHQDKLVNFSTMSKS